LTVIPARREFRAFPCEDTAVKDAFVPAEALMETSEKVRRTARRLVLPATLGVLAVCLVSAGCLARGLLSEAEPAPAEPFAPGVEALGQVDVVGGVLELSPTRAGRVLEVPAREGDTVSAGAALVRLDDRPVRYELAQVEAARKAAQAKLEAAREAAAQHPGTLAQQQALLTAARERLSAARRELARQQRLRRQDLVKEDEVALAQDRVKELEALAQAEERRLEALRKQDPKRGVRQAQAELDESQARLDQAKYALEQCTLRAPEPGTVLEVTVGPGESAGPASRRAAVVFAPERARVVRVEVEQEFVERLAVGQPAVAKDQANPERTWKGRLVRIAPWYRQGRSLLQQPPRYRDVATVECMVELEAGGPPLRLGQRMVVTIGGR
jgi:HlyD family secretion protein